MLELGEPCPEWHSAVRHGRWNGIDSLVMLGPEGGNLARARRAASGIIGMQRAGLLTLLAVTDAKGRVAWVYEDVDGVGLSQALSADSSALSARAAAEIVAAVADTLSELPGWTHPGPEPRDLLVGPKGDLWLAGMVGPFPQSPWNLAPGGGTDDAALTYRLGTLLAHLVCGVPPGPAVTRDAHGPLVRRVLMRALGRRGPPLTERYCQWMRGMLAWNPAERPPLSSVGTGLRAAAAEMEDAPLSRWAGGSWGTLHDKAPDVDTTDLNNPVTLETAPLADDEWPMHEPATDDTTLVRDVEAMLAELEGAGLSTDVDTLIRHTQATQIDEEETLVAYKDPTWARLDTDSGAMPTQPWSHPGVRDLSDSGPRRLDPSRPGADTLPMHLDDDPGTQPIHEGTAPIHEGTAPIGPDLLVEDTGATVVQERLPMVGSMLDDTDHTHVADAPPPGSSETDPLLGDVPTVPPTPSSTPAGGTFLDITRNQLHPGLIGEEPTQLLHSPIVPEPMPPPARTEERGLLLGMSVAMIMVLFVLLLVAMAVLLLVIVGPPG